MNIYCKELAYCGAENLENGRARLESLIVKKIPHNFFNNII